MKGWPDDAKRTMTEVAKIIGDAINNAPCEKCHNKNEQIRDLEEQVNIGYFDREVCIPELQQELARLRTLSDNLDHENKAYERLHHNAVEERDRLREVLEWACHIDQFYETKAGWDNFVVELRTRAALKSAGEEGETPSLF